MILTREAVIKVWWKGVPGRRREILIPSLTPALSALLPFLHVERRERSERERRGIKEIMVSG